jgi:DNA-directed RNA polymerase alpha subunit
MKSKPTLTESWQSFLAELVIKFIELNREEIGGQYSSILVKFSKGQSIEKIAADEKLSTTRIRQLTDTARRKLERAITEAKVSELKSLTEVCKGIEVENNSLRRTLKIHGLTDNTPISKLELSQRAQAVLEKLGITSIEQISTIEFEDILRIRGAGMKTISEIETSLAKFGLRIGGSLPS